MKFKLLYFFVLVSTYCQSQTQPVFTDTELQSFVEIYMEAKYENQRSTQEDQQLLSEFGVSVARYQEITRAAIIDSHFKLSDNEKKLMKEIQRQNKIFESVKNDRVLALCKKHLLLHDRYQMILKKYNSDIKFQRSLHSYFQNYLRRFK